MTFKNGVAESRLTALLAEDDEDDVFLIRRAFKRLGLFKCLMVASDGEQTIAYIAGQRQYSDRQTYPFPDVLILDQAMPLMTGLDVLCWVRSEPCFECLPVVLLSVEISPAQAEMAGRLKAVCCSKTAQLGDMPQAIEQAIHLATDHPVTLSQIQIHGPLQVTPRAGLVQSR